MSDLDQIFGDAKALYGQYSNIRKTLAVGSDRERMAEWLRDYAARTRDGWHWAWAPRSGLHLGSRKSGWKGAPMALSDKKTIPSAQIWAVTEPHLVYQIADAAYYSAKMSGIGMAKHPTWVGGSLCVAILVESGQQLPAFTAVPKWFVPRGRTHEKKIATAGPFTLFSAKPSALGETSVSQITAALTGWTGHVRGQFVQDCSVYMAWDWLGSDKSKWSDNADKTLSVLRTVRDAHTGA